MSERSQDQQRFDECLPFYVNGQLSETDQKWVDDYAAHHPEVRLWLRFDENIRASIQSTTPPTPESIRLARFLQDFGGLEVRQSLWRRLLVSISRSWLVPAPALALIALVMVAQGVLLAGRFGAEQNEVELYRSLAIGCDNGPRIRVVFKPEATHGEVAILLRKIEGRFTDGPTDTGEFWISVPSERSVEEARNMLKSSLMVEEALITPGSGPKCQ